MNFEFAAKRSKSFVTVCNHLQKNKLFHAYLISISDEILGKSIAFEILMALFCPEGGCGKCSACKKIESQSHVDISILDGSEKTIKVEEISQLVENCAVRSFEGEKRAVVILAAENMTVQAQNKILKTLEEPPAAFHFFLFTNNLFSLLNPLRSRCIVIENQFATAEVISKQLEILGIDEKRAKVAAKKSLGNVSRAFELAKDEKPDWEQIAIELLTEENLKNNIPQFASMILKDQKAIGKILDFVIFTARDALVKKLSAPSIVFDVSNQILFEKLALCSNECLEQLIQNANNAKTKLGMRVSANVVIDEFLLGILEEKQKCKK